MGGANMNLNTDMIKHFKNKKEVYPTKKYMNL